MKLKSSVAVACFLPGRSKDLSAPLYNRVLTTKFRLTPQPNVFLHIIFVLDY